MTPQETENSGAVAEYRRELEDRTPLYATIVVGTDGSTTAQEAVRHAAGIARAHGGKLHLVCAGPSTSKAAIDRDSADAPADIVHAINPASDVTALLEGVAEDVRAAGVECVIHPCVDVDPADAILKTAQRCSADLIVVGNKGMAGVSRLLGSVPNKISHHASCSVAIIRTT